MAGDVRERAARVLWPECWMGTPDGASDELDARRAERLQRLDAVLAVVADVEGIAGVLAGHRTYFHSDWGWMCSCGFTPSFDAIGSLTRHQAEAVAAYIQDRP